MKIYKDKRIRDSWKRFSQVSRFQQELKDKDYWKSHSCQEFHKWNDHSTMCEFSIPYISELVPREPEKSIFHPNSQPIRESYDVAFSANKLSKKDNQEIIDSTLLYAKTLTKEQIYKEMRASFNRTATLYHLTQIENKRYLVLRDYLENLGKKITLQVVPVFDEPMLDNKTRRYIEIKDREFRREQEKLEVKENNALLKIANLVKETRIKLRKK